MTEPLFIIDPARDDMPMHADQLVSGWTLTLPEHVKRHAMQAMRLREGDRFAFSDGEGLRVECAVVDAVSGVAQVIEAGKVPRPTVRLALIQALSKTGHDEQAIDAATQLGVDEVIPWQARRSIARWKDGKSERKWQQTLVAASEQSRRAWVPELQPCISSKQLAALCLSAAARGDMVLVLHQDAAQPLSELATRVAALRDVPRTIYVVVGPEGGIDEAEIADFTSEGALSMVLGQHILRASLAGPAALAVLSYLLGRYDAALAADSQ